MKKTKMLRLVSLLLCLFVLASCETGGAGNGETDTNSDVSNANELVLIANGQAHCTIVRPKGSNKDMMSLCAELADAIQQNAEVTVEVAADTKQASEGFVEILIGDTNRAESAQAKEKLGNFEYSISVINGKVVIAASDFVMLENAVREFVSMFTRDSEQSEKNAWTISLDYSKTFDGSGDYAYNSYIGKGFELTVEYTKIKELSPAQSGPASNGKMFQYMQGGCTDGTYYYFFMCTGANPQPEKCRILKYDLATKTRVMVSEELALGHAADAVYVSDNNTIVVVSGSNNNYYMIDPDTLTVKETKWISHSGGIAYNPDQKVYITRDENDTLHYMDENFNSLKKIPRENTFIGFDLSDASTYSGQGITSDGKYIYVLEYQILESGLRNNLAVYDLSGKFVQSIPLDVGCETENIIIWNDTFYIFCNNSTWTGAQCYQIKLVPQFND